MIPPSIAPETPGSERRVYGRLREALPDSWTVMHSQRFLLPGNLRPREGELDFLILNPDRGVIGLEVKGGQVGRTADGWYSVDRHGERHSIKDPGRQASGAIFAIGEYLNDARGSGRRGFRCRHGWGVGFPDTVVEGDLGPDIPRPVVLDSDDLAGMQTSVERIFDYWRLNGPLSESAVRGLVDALHERFPPASTLAFLFRFEDEDFLRLTDEQLTLLDSLGRPQTRSDRRSGRYGEDRAGHGEGPPFGNHRRPRAAVVLQHSSRHPPPQTSPGGRIHRRDVSPGL